MTTFDEAYFQELVGIALIGLIIAFLILVYTILFCCCRICICDCCPSCCVSLRTCCCGGKPHKFYTSSRKSCTLCLLISFWLIVLIGIIVGYNGNRQVTKGLDGLSQEIVNTIEDIRDRAERSAINFASLNLNQPSIQQSFYDLYNATDDAAQIGQDTREIVLHYNGYREAAIHMGFIVPLIALCLAAFGICCKMGFTQYPFVFSCLLSLVFIWLSFAFHAPAAKLSSDGCDQADKFLENPSINNDFLLSCLQNDTYFSTYDSTYNQLQTYMNDLQQQANNTLGVTIAAQLPPLSGTLEQSAIAIADFVTNQTAIVQQSLSNIDPSLTNTTEIQQLNQTLTYVQVVTNMVLDIATLLDCVYLKGLIFDFKSKFCDELVGGVIAIVVADLLIGIFLIPATYYVMAAYNQFGIRNAKMEQFLGVHVEGDGGPPAASGQVVAGVAPASASMAPSSEGPEDIALMSHSNGQHHHQEGQQAQEGGGTLQTDSDD